MHRESGGRKEPLLSAVSVRKSFGSTDALRGAGIEVPAGEIVAITGPSGSGKSTLLHCLAGILRPDDGEVWFDGSRIDTMSEAERSALRRSRFGFLFQFGQLIPELPAVENVALPLLLTGVKRRTALELARAWLSRLGVNRIADRLPGEMSGGQAQRVALARALVHGPEVVFADEPTGSLDSKSSEAVMRLLTDTARNQGAAVILITHDPRTAGFADREISLLDGCTAAFTGR